MISFLFNLMSDQTGKLIIILDFNSLILIGGAGLVVIAGAVYFLRSSEEPSTSKVETNDVLTSQLKEQVYTFSFRNINQTKEEIKRRGRMMMMMLYLLSLQSQPQIHTLMLHKKPLYQIKQM